MSYRSLDMMLLGELSDFKNGINYRRDESGETVRIINVKELVAMDYIDDQVNLPTIELPKSKYKSYLINKNDIIIARSASPGEVIIFKGSKPTIYSGFSIKIDFDRSKLYPEYLFYYLKHYKNRVVSVSNGTIFKNLNQKILSSIQVPLLEITEQKAIAKILSSLDDKIEINNKINKNLEEMAQALYKQWFVDFEFPNEDGEPYKSSGGEMIVSELGPVPKGWEVEPITNSQLTQLQKTGIEEFEDEKIYLATADIENTKIINSTTLVTYDSRPSRANMQPIQNTVWFAKMMDSRKLLRISCKSKELINGYILSTGFTGLKCNDSLNYIFTYISSDNFKMVKDGLATGTTMAAVNNTSLEKIKILIPNKKVLTEFELITNAFYEEIYSNNIQNEKLKDLSDTLLPKLMSGEIEVPIKE